jgi:hypothetical protein
MVRKDYVLKPRLSRAFYQPRELGLQSLRENWKISRRLFRRGKCSDHDLR